MGLEAGRAVIYMTIIEEVASSGRSVAEVLRDPKLRDKYPDWPKHPSTFWHRLRDDPDIAAAYYEAEKLRASVQMDVALDIVDGKHEPSGDTSRDKARAELRLKIAERLLKRYSNRLTAVTEDDDGKKPLGVIALPIKDTSGDDST